MTTTRNKLLANTALLLACAAVVFLLLPSRKDKSATNVGIDQSGSAVRKTVTPLGKRTSDLPSASRPAGREHRQQQAVPPEAVSSHKKAVAAWESLITRLPSQQDTPTEGQALLVKDVFDRLGSEDQLDCIHHGLNLLPDGHFTALSAILYDKAENPEVLDAIFSDTLNRPDEFKIPLLKNLAKDRAHPCFFESARILDATGKLRLMPTPAQIQVMSGISDR